MVAVKSPAEKLPLEDALPPHLRDLNPPQREAVCHFEGPILVLAGAGSGKTRVLTRRIAHLILQHRVRPEQILAVTFTNKATEEMRGRLRALLGNQYERLWIATFHSAALRILRRHAQRLSYSNDFVVYDEQDAKGVLKTVLKALDIDDKRFPIQGFSRVIDKAKNSCISPEEFTNKFPEKAHTSYEEKLRAEVYDAYQKALMRANAMDFGDLIMNAVTILQRHREVREYYQNALRFVLVDEFQDTNLVQYQFVELLTAKYRNLFVVGDDDQSIYKFRGATVRNILEFERDFAGARMVVLEQNYRSSATILDAGHSVIQHISGRRKKKLWTEREAESEIVSYVGSDEMEEAAFVADEIYMHHSRGVSFNQIAVFYRTNAQSRALEEALLDRHIPYRIFGGLKFYERKEVKDILAYLRLVVNEYDDQSFLRVINTPPRGIGAQSLKGILDFAKDNNISLLRAAETLAESNKHIRQFAEVMRSLRELAPKVFLSVLIERAVEDTGYADKLRSLKDPTAQSRLENLKELEAIGRSMESKGAEELLSTREVDMEIPAKAIETQVNHLLVLREFLDRVSLTTATDVVDDAESAQKNEYVSLMTLHLAKGLEFPFVFLTGMEEGLLPHYRSLYIDEELEEERRLCYVGITRAMQQLYITRAASRGMFASGEYSGFYREPSRFFYDIPDELIQTRR